MDRRWSRRRALRMLAATGLAVWSTGCAVPTVPGMPPDEGPGDDTAPDDAAPTAMPAPAATAPSAAAPQAVPRDPGRLGRAPVRELAWSADEQSLVALDIEGASWFDVASGTEWRRASLTDLTRPFLTQPHALDIAPDAGVIVWRTAGVAQLLDSTTGALLVRHDIAELTADGPLAWSPDGRWLALGTAGGVVMIERDAPQLPVTVVLPGTVEQLAWASDSTSLAGVGRDGNADSPAARTLVAWDTAQRTELQRRALTPGEQGSLASIGGDWRLLEATWPGAVLNWGGDGVREVVQLDGIDVQRVTASPDGTALLLECLARRHRPPAWDNDGWSGQATLVPTTGRIVALTGDAPSPVVVAAQSRLRWSADATLVLGMASDVAEMRARDGMLVASVPLIDTGTPTTLAWSPDGSQLVSSDGSTVALWSVADGALLGSWPAASDGSGWSPDGSWPAASGDTSWSPDGAYALVSGVLIDAAARQMVRRIDGGQLAAGGTMVAFATDCNVSRYEIVTGRVRPLVDECDNAIASVSMDSLAPDGQRIFIGVRAYQTSWSAVFDVETGAEIKRYGDADSGEYVDPSAGTWMRSSDGYEWDPRGEAPEQAEQAARRELALDDTTQIGPASPDGRVLPIFDASGRILLWSPDTRSEQARIETGLPLSALAWSPDGSQLALAAHGVGIRFWQLAAT